MKRLNYALGALAVLALLGAGAWFFKPHSGGCEERYPSDEPGLSRRGDELLQELDTSLAGFLAQGTTAARAASAPEAMATMADVIRPLLSAPRRLTMVWRAKSYFNLDPSHAVTVLCAVRSPTADTLNLPGNVRDASLLVYEVAGNPIGMRIVLQLHLEDGVYRWQSIAAHPFAQRGRVAEDFERQGERLGGQGKDFEAFLAYLAAEKLSILGTGIETATHNRLLAKVVAAQASLTQTGAASRARIHRDNDHLRFSMRAAMDVGLIPVVEFVSSKSGEETRPEAQAIYDDLVRQAPTFRTDYAGVSLKAFPETPITGKQYSTFSTWISAP